MRPGLLILLEGTDAVSTPRPETPLALLGAVGHPAGSGGKRGEGGRRGLPFHRPAGAGDARREVGNRGRGRRGPGGRVPPAGAAPRGEQAAASRGLRILRRGGGGASQSAHHGEGRRCPEYRVLAAEVLCGGGR